MSLRNGACHCEAVQFEAEVPEPLAGSRCNCSICAMKGAVMVYVPMAALRITAGEGGTKQNGALACYSFNTGAAKHYFCQNCGIHCFHQARSDPHLFAINAAVLEGVDVYRDFPEIAVADGQRHSLDNAGVRYQAGILRFEPSPGGMWLGPNNLAK